MIRERQSEGVWRSCDRGLAFYRNASPVPHGGCQSANRFSIEAASGIAIMVSGKAEQGSELGGVVPHTSYGSARITSWLGASCTFTDGVEIADHPTCSCHLWTSKLDIHQPGLLAHLLRKPDELTFASTRSHLIGFASAHEAEISQSRH